MRLEGPQTYEHAPVTLCALVALCLTHACGGKLTEPDGAAGSLAWSEGGKTGRTRHRLSG
jgi:hypothetical protein